MNPAYLSRVRYILGVATAMTLIAELFYLLVWGFLLFPQGNPAAKAVWTISCGIAMGASIGAATVWLIEGRYFATAAIWRAAAVMAAIGSYCAWFCSQIDTRFEYFGGGENQVLFLVAGIVPAIAGGLLYGWIIYGRNAATGHASHV